MSHLVKELRKSVSIWQSCQKCGYPFFGPLCILENVSKSCAQITLDNDSDDEIRLIFHRGLVKIAITETAGIFLGIKINK